MSLFAHTSTSLQKQYPDIYKEFFAKHNYVLSIPYSIRRSPNGVGNQHKLSTMVTSIPLYQWLGINKYNKKHTSTTITLYEYEKQEFTTSSFNTYVDYTKKLETILDKLFKEYQIDHRISFGLLSESGRGRGFGFTGALCAGLGHYMVEHNNNGTEKHEEAYIEAALKIETALRGIHANGDRIVASIQTQAPTIIYTRGYEKQDIGEENIKWGYMPLNESEAVFPFDWCVLFSGNTADVSKIERSLSKHEKKREQHAERIQKLDREIINEGKWNSYIGHIAQESTFFDILFDTFVITVAQFNTTVKEIVEWNDEEYNIVHALQYLNEMAHIAELIQGNQQVLQDIHTNFNMMAHSEQEILGCIPLYFGKYGGSYLLATPYGKSRVALEKVIQELQKENEHISFECCSRRDGSIKDGVMKHQHISGGVYSSYIHKDFLKYTDNRGITEIGTYADLFEKHNNGFLLDVEANRVYLNGEKLTKEHLKSQTTTIEVLSVLLDNLGEEVSNMEFDPSTFTRQQNQMLGKIIGPLRKLTLSQFDRELQLSCIGSLREFFLKLDEKDILIGKIQKLI